MTTDTEYSRTDLPPAVPRWLALVLATAGTLIAIGVLWSLAPSTCGVGEAFDSSFPSPCTGDGGEAPALTTAGILAALLASVFVVAFTVQRRRGVVILILAGAMLLVLVVGLMATAAAAGSGPVISI